MEGRLFGLDALRGIAAVAVLALHLDYKFGEDDGLWTRAYLAVDFFFVLSGYVMARTYERGPSLRLSFARFMRLRYARLWPPMAVAALLSALYLLLRGVAPEAIPAILFGLVLLLPNPLTWNTSFGDYPVNAPAWSITSELVGNALHAALFARLSMGGLALVAGVALVVMQALDPGLNATTDVGFVKGLGRVFVAYSLGVIVWRQWGVKPLGSPLIGLLGLPLSILLLKPAPALADLLFLAACPFFIRAALALPASRMVGIFGALSFPLYAVHMPIILIAKEAGYSKVTALGFAIVGALLVATLIDRRIFRWAKPQPATP